MSDRQSRLLVTVTRAARRVAAAGVVVLALASAARPARAQAKLQVTGSPAQLDVRTAMAGGTPLVVVDATTEYSVRSTPARTKKITARLDTPLPAGVTLTVTLGATRGATSMGAVTLDTSPRDVVIGIQNFPTTYTGSITYQLTASPTANVTALSTRMVTFSLVNQ